MRKYIFSFLFISLISSIKAQEIKGLYIQFAYADSDLLGTQDLIGSASYSGKQNKLFALYCQKNINSRFSYETGLRYSTNTFEIHPTSSDPLVCTAARTEQLDLISLSLTAQFFAFKFLVLYAGPMIDHHFNSKSIDNQTGLGYTIGINALLKVKKIAFRMGPSFDQHGLISLDKNHQKLTNFGLEFGLGYLF